MHTRRLAMMLWLTVACPLVAEAAEVPSREAALEQLLTERETPEAFTAAINAARIAGINEQAILEARFLYHVDRDEDEKLAELTPEFLKRRDDFNIEDSEIFATVEDWLAVTEYVQAIAALQKNDPEAFKKHITEAFWLSPQQGPAFAPHINRQRLALAMKLVRIDFATRLVCLHQGEAVTLAKLNAEAPATLLHFWSPWSRECEVTMPDFIATAIELSKHGIAVVSILPEQSAEIRADALEIIQPLGPNPPGSWLLDRPNDPLSLLLRVQNLPTIVLLDPDGSVLFNGHPVDEALWKALSDIAPGMARPATAVKD